jgi:hypothetical protein
MRRITVALLLAVAGAPAAGAGFTLRPGLYELRVVKQLVDGQDMSAQLTAAAAHLQQAMASLPAEQRAKMEAMMQQRGVSQGGDGAIRISVSPEAAKRAGPFVDKDGRCQPAAMTQNGNTTSFEVNCTLNGMTTTGHGEATVAGDLISTRADMTSRSNKGEPHVMHNESQMRFLGARCGDVKPVELPPAR